MTDFFLISTELASPYKPRACRVLKRIRSQVRDDMALVKITPVIPCDVYGTDQDLSELILGSRFEGNSIYSVSQWPIYVYICRLMVFVDHNMLIDANDLQILDWGAIFENEASALKVLR